MDTMTELLESASGRPIYAYAITRQAQENGVSEKDTFERMKEYLATMRASVHQGLDASLRSNSGMTGGQASKLYTFCKSPLSLIGGLTGKACAYALAVAECNACMGRIVAAPTAGACGILPGALLALGEEKNYTDDQLTNGLFTAAVIGELIAKNASISGAEGGCQAECGSAAAMAAAAVTEVCGGSAQMASYAASFAIMNLLGLVCDPVAGLVEVPCVYRNVGSVSVALSSAQMALSGIVCPLPFDEVVAAMKDVGDALPTALRETAEGGCAACPSARKCVK